MKSVTGIKKLRFIPRHIDPISGLSYREPTVRDLPKNNIATPKEWIWKTIGTTKLLAEHSNREGAASLSDMAWRVILCHLDIVTVELLQALGWEISERIWQKIKKNQLDSDAMWMIFVKAFGNSIIQFQTEGLVTHNSFRLPLFTVSAHTNHITDYMVQLCSPLMQFVTVLALVHHRPDDVQDWVRLSELDNLGALWVESDGPHGNLLDETVVKEWAVRATTSRGFPKLKFLRILRRGHFDTDILSCIAALPKLRAFYLSCWADYAELRELDGQSYWIEEEESRLCTILKGRNLELSSNRSLGALNAWKIILAFDQGDDVDSRINLPVQTPILAVDGTAVDVVIWVRNETRPHYHEDTWFERKQNLPVSVHASVSTINKSQANNPHIKRNSMKRTRELLSDFMK
jgi:hypothetical protein